MAHTGRTRGLLLGLVSALLFGIATPASKQLLASLPATVLAGLLYLGAALALLPIVLRRKGERRREQDGGGGAPAQERKRPDRRNQLRLLGAVFFGGVAGPVLLLLGLERAQAASVSMLLSLETVATAVLALLFFREQMGRWTWIASAGVVVASGMLAFDRGVPSLIGALLVLAACVAWGLDNNLTAVIDGFTPSESTFWKGLIAGVVNLSLGFALHRTGLSGAWLWALLVGALSYGMSITLYIHSAQLIGAVRSQMVFATAPVFGVVGALAWLGEALVPLQLGAAALLAVALLLLSLERHEHEHVHEAVEHEHSHRHDEGHHLHQHEGLPASHRHSHRHRHERLIHSHQHWPDLHHRHQH
ncbi:MAG: EamA family transporter [Planctomycetota bacterium]|nr:MAG: EamA family transporter [Planctomycetota bacterium]